MKKIFLATSVAALSLSLAVPAFAQTFTMMGNEVPADQVERIQAQCDTLFSSEGAGAGASDISTNATSTVNEDGKTSETEIATSSERTETNGTGSTDGGNPTSDATPGAVAAVDFETMDMGTITLQDCRDGGFTAN